VHVLVTGGAGRMIYAYEGLQRKTPAKAESSLVLILFR